MGSAAPLLYEKVARLIDQQIATGALSANDRVPSVRAMSRAARVSVSTVVQAYLRLESAGVIEARPQSGFYVRAPRVPEPAQPRSRLPRSTRPRTVAGEVLETCGEAMLRADVLPLSGAAAAPAFYPNRRLNHLTREVLRDHPQHAGELIRPPGDLDLRREIAKRMAAGGCATDPEEVVITSGAMDAITLALRVLCKPGDTVLVESPTYYGILQTIEDSSLKVIEAPNHPGEGIDVDAVRQKLRATKLAAAVLMPNFNNPVGSLTSDERKRALVQTLTSGGVPIIEDDTHGELHYGLERPSLMRSFDEAGLVITCGSVSKTIALGFRIGWAVSSQFQRELARAKSFTSVACPTLQQKVLARYYASGGYDRYLRRLRGTIAANVQHMSAAVSRCFPIGTKMTRPAGGLVLWIELPREIDSVALFRSALAHRIGIYPGVVFSASAGYRNYIRLNCGLPWAPAVEMAVETLGKLICPMVAS
jgi:DNA-binding transcriptional MocR family regulator